ncbi:MAG TPA: T9SS type A sorting domain-containing protein, partial [Flavisolibacter sp.]|nr:T9SS type A sorting domain-containing protein [Flavisolibacter sp.]
IGFMPSNPSGNYSFSDVYPLEEGYYKLVWFESRGFESEMVLAVALPKGKLQLVPNPASTQVTVLVGGFQKGADMVSIYDLNGRLLVKQSFQQAQSCQVNISTLQEGTYILKAEQEGETHIAKLIKE